jgi:hypothetical protein
VALSHRLSKQTSVVVAACPNPCSVDGDAELETGEADGDWVRRRWWGCWW